MDIIGPIEQEHKLRRYRKAVRPLMAARTVMCLMAGILLLDLAGLFPFDYPTDLIARFVIFIILYLGMVWLSFRKAVVACLIATALTAYIAFKSVEDVKEPRDIISLCIAAVFLVVLIWALFYARDYQRFRHLRKVEHSD